MDLLPSLSTAGTPQLRVKTVSILDLIPQIAPLISDKMITKQDEELQAAVLAEKCSREEKILRAPVSDQAMVTRPTLVESADRASGAVCREMITKRKEVSQGSSAVSHGVLRLQGGAVRPGGEGGEGNSISRAVRLSLSLSSGWGGRRRRRIPISTARARKPGQSQSRRPTRPTAGARWRTSSQRETAGWRENWAQASSRTPSIPPTGLEAVKSNNLLIIIINQNVHNNDFLFLD